MAVNSYTDEPAEICFDLK